VGDSPPVGVITFYGAQHELIKQELKCLDTGLSELVQAGTVDGFQGQEFPLVILSAVRSNDNGFTGFLKMPNRINVAMSRAQRQLIIVGDCRTLGHPADKKGSMPFRKVLELMRTDAQPGKIFASREVCND
jgi:superfamily I DNA and/or RNA helicase